MTVHAACRDHEIALDVLACRQLRRRARATRPVGRARVVDPPEPERDSLAEVTEHDPKVREPVEGAAADQPDAVQPYLGLEPVDTALAAVTRAGRRQQRR